MNALEIIQNLISFFKADMWALYTGLVVIALIMMAFEHVRDVFCWTDADLKHSARVAQNRRNKNCDEKRKN